jgi:MFS family permease
MTIIKAQLISKKNFSRFWFFVFLVIAYFCSLYGTDAIGPIANLLHVQLGFNNVQLGSLNAVANLPNIVFVILAGILCDRIGPIKVLVIAMILCSVGSLLVAISSNLSLMLKGRLFFGIGSESLVVAEAAAIAYWFRGPLFAFLLALHVAIARLGSFSADMSPTFFPHLYTNWQDPMWLAFGISLIAVVASIACFRISRSQSFIDASTHIGIKIKHDFQWSLLGKFDRSFWYIVLLGVMFYSPLLAFRGTFSIAYFQNAHGLTLAQAGQLNSYVFLAAFFVTPVFGWICDRFGHHALLLLAGIILTFAAFFMLAMKTDDLVTVTVLFGITYALIPAVLWPMTGYVVSPVLLGTAYGIMDATQGLGQGGSNLIAGWFNDLGNAGIDNPSGYNNMLWFFSALCILGILSALLLFMRSPKFITANQKS